MVRPSAPAANSASLYACRKKRINYYLHACFLTYGEGRWFVEMANLELHDTMYVVDGLVLPKFIEQEDMDKLKDLSLRDDDAWMYSDLPQGRYHMDTV